MPSDNDDPRGYGAARMKPGETRLYEKTCFAVLFTDGDEVPVDVLTDEADAHRMANQYRCPPMRVAKVRITEIPDPDSGVTT